MIVNFINQTIALFIGAIVATAVYRETKTFAWFLLSFIVVATLSVIYFTLVDIKNKL